VTLTNLILRSAIFHWRTNVAVTLGVAAAASVLAGALVVGDSVRGSLRSLAVGRLGRTDFAISSTGFFREALAANLKGAENVRGAAPMIVARGFVTHEPSRRRASDVLVYGIDERFWAFNAEPARDGVFVSPALAAELGAREGDVLLTRVQRPSGIPVESLFGRKEDVGRTIRLQLSAQLPREHLGEFALQPQQTEVRAVFVPLRRIQRDLAVRDQVNTILLEGPPGSEAVARRAMTLDDVGVRVTTLEDLKSLAVESASGIVNEPLERAARTAGEKLGLRPVPVFTYLANTIRAGNRQVPYSLITAIDLTQLGDSGTASLAPRSLNSENRTPSPPTPSPNPEPRIPADLIVLNDWTARELNAAPGDRIEIDYFLWDPAAGLQTKTAAFTLERIVAIAGLAADRRLAPEYPGITVARSLADWDPPFPIDLSRVRPIDEKYWNVYRTTSKAFITFERGRELWQSRYGGMTSIRFVTGDRDVGPIADELRRELRASLSPAAMGVVVVPVREAALQASTGATDFGEYFTYFSFFVVVSALLLVVLFFKLGIEQRLRQIGILRAAGYTIPTIRRLLLTEGIALAALGGLLGLAGATLYGRVVVHGLRTWWVGAVGTTLLQLHVGWPSLLAGAAGGIIAAGLCVIVSLRSVGRLTPRSLLSAQAIEASDQPGRSDRRSRLAIVFAAAAAVSLTLGFVRPAAQAGAFFGAGIALLIAVLLVFSAWLRGRDRQVLAGRGVWPVLRLGFRSAAFRPSRSVLSAALIASAAFIIVSVDAFRRGGGDITTDPHSGSGGFILLAQSELPLLHDPDDAGGRDALMIRAPELSRATFTRFRLRQGQDASCLNLYRPTNPTIIAPEPGFIDSNRFAFSASLAESDAERANPWLLLRRQFDDGSVPVIADATSLQYVLHQSVGDTFSMDIGADRPLVLRFVGALADSVLQGELIMAEEQFTRLFPGLQGYRFFLIDDPSVRTVADATALAGTVEQELETFGMDAVTTTERLESFHRVENTYLSTFQALGGLGLLLGTVGLATVMFRNVLERRRELALLRAVGYNARHISSMIMAEATLLLGAGLAAGVGCAVLAVAPAWLSRGGTLPGLGLVLLLAAVLIAGMVSSFIATRAALAGRMLDALKAE
jgi:putative ABC transport system permease protein